MSRSKARKRFADGGDGVIRQAAARDRSASRRAYRTGTTSPRPVDGRPARKSPTRCAGAFVVAAAGSRRRVLPSGAGRRCRRAGGPDNPSFRRDADDDAGVGVTLGARILAHAVGDDAALLGRGGNDRAAGAHAEAIDRAAVRGVVHELVVGGAQDGVAGARRRSGTCRSATADARCGRRWRRAWAR